MRSRGKLTLPGREPDASVVVCPASLGSDPTGARWLPPSPEPPSGQTRVRTHQILLVATPFLGHNIQAQQPVKLLPVLRNVEALVHAATIP